MTKPTDSAPDTAARDATAQAPARADLPPAAQRALAEAQERRRLAPKDDAPEELGGRDGLNPTRYGDYEKKGLAVDF